MKNKISIMIIAIMASILFACNSESTKGDKFFHFISFARIDSCQYDMNNDYIIYYFGDTAIRLSRSINTISVITKTDTTELDGMLAYTKTLASRWPKPESYASVCLRKFNKLIRNEIISSCSTNHMESTTYYDFYLETYAVSVIVEDAIAFKNPEDISICAKDINGTISCAFSYNKGWSMKDKKSILTTLLSRCEKQKPSVSKKIPVSVWTKEYEESVKKKIKDAVF
ncbi:MAG: hypothetical protein NT085_00205 [candidate division SR1 bacterium]|nr:hypothetical protein [candidate division SR1 bacterium]